MAKQIDSMETGIHRHESRESNLGTQWEGVRVEPYVEAGVEAGGTGCHQGWKQGWKRGGSRVEAGWKQGGSNLLRVEALQISPTFSMCCYASRRPNFSLL